MESSLFKSDLSAGPMEKLDFEAMPLDDLWTLHERIGKLLSERIVAEKRQLEARLLRLNAGKPDRGSTGVDAGAVDAKPKPPRRTYPKVFPKYQNSKAPFETWSGRGKQPRWLVSALKAGNRVEDFEIANAAGAKSRAAGQGRRD
jgi:DNA-binding protein H-NS